MWGGYCADVTGLALNRAASFLEASSAAASTTCCSTTFWCLLILRRSKGFTVVFCLGLGFGIICGEEIYVYFEEVKVGIVVLYTVDLKFIYLFLPVFVICILMNSYVKCKVVVPCIAISGGMCDIVSMENIMHEPPVANLRSEYLHHCYSAADDCIAVYHRI